MGEEYDLTVPSGNGFLKASTYFTVAEQRLNVELALSREYAQASVTLINAKAGSGHWSEALALPKDLFINVKLANDPNFVLGSLRAQHAGLQQQMLLQLTPDIEVMAHERYAVEVQPSLHVLRAACELNVGAGSVPATAELRVPRAWKPAVVVELRSSDLVALPAGLRLRLVHRDLRVEVAQATTDLSDISVRCVVTVAEAFFIGEVYVVLVESARGVAATEREFVVTQAAFGGGVDLSIELARASAQLRAHVFVQPPSEGHWSTALTLPPQQLEVVHEKQLVQNSTVAWHPGVRDAIVHISALTKVFVGHTYTIRVAESDSVLPVALPVIVDEGEAIAELPLRRKSFDLTVTLRSREELPLPYGIKVLVRHKLLNCIVASGMCGEPEGAHFEEELDQAHSAHAVLSAAQAAEAVEAVKTFMMENKLDFNGCADANALKGPHCGRGSLAFGPHLSGTALSPPAHCLVHLPPSDVLTL